MENSFLNEQNLNHNQSADLTAEEKQARELKAEEEREELATERYLQMVHEAATRRGPKSPELFHDDKTSINEVDSAKTIDSNEEVPEQPKKKEKKVELNSKIEESTSTPSKKPFSLDHNWYFFLGIIIVVSIVSYLCYKHDLHSRSQCKSKRCHWC